MSDNNNQKRVPATVFTGFLGSGKTTIITHLLKYLDNMGQKVAYLKNEIGDADLDAKLVQGQNFMGKEILNGCICCTLVGPFMAAIDELIDDFQMDRIIVESAGSADPASMALMVSNHPRLIRDGVITIVDALNFNGFEDISTVANRQAELTDLIVLNKVELVDDERKRVVVGYVRELNAYAPIVEAQGGKLNADLAFGLGAPELEKLLKEHQSSEEGEKHHHHLEDDQIQAFTYQTSTPMNEEKLLQAIKNLPQQVFRVKGIVNFETGPRVVNSIFKRVDVTAVPDGVTEQASTKLIVIGFRINELREEVERVFSECLVG